MKRHPVTQQQPNAHHVSGVGIGLDGGAADPLGMTQVPVRTLGRMHDRIAELTQLLSQLSGENNVLAGILRDVQPVIETIVPENDDEAERLFGLRVAIAHAVDPYKREGTLL